MPRRRVQIAIESFPLATPFRISRALRTAADVVTVTIHDGAAAGRGECRPTERYGETCRSVRDQIAGLAGRIEAGLDRHELQSVIAPGAARNAVDCALWDLEVKSSLVSAWDIAGRARPLAVETAYSLSLDTPARMAEQAGRARRYRLIKIKLGGDGLDVERIAAVRAERETARLIGDANEALSPENLVEVLDAAARHGLEAIEQPLPAEDDHLLDGLDRPVILCADESCRTSEDVARLAGRYDMVNIKLDKSGGLTEALKLDATARAAGMKVMVGCMFSTSLGIAPAQLIAATADIVDLDAPIFLAADRDPAISFDGGSMSLAPRELWG
jgi:L-alanine-DL-glutamate epimerase-like enolase superfamily enzyme